MKIQSIKVDDYPPIKHLELKDLGSTVIIAGANGSGKTRLKQAIVQTLQGSPTINLTLAPTRSEETRDFQGTTLEVQPGQENQILNNYINSRKFGRGKYVGSLVQVDSERNIRPIQYNQISWQVSDPDDQETPSNFYHSEFTGRWEDFINYIHRKVAAHDRKLSQGVKLNPELTGAEILKKNPHPIEKYKKIFSQLLPDKELLDIDPASVREFSYVYKNGDENPLPFSSLSSGEQEVVKVVFDIVRKEIRHSVVIVDEPELHLHPTLAFKLIETLKSIGGHTNQYIFLTHSADLISTYYSTGDVYFIDAVPTGANQAHKLSELNRSHKDLVQLIGENLGLFAVGKKLVFVEGENSSIDRLVYHSIAQKVLPDVKVIPVGSVQNVITLNAIEEQIRNSVFGIDLFMIRDRDGLTDGQIKVLERNNRIRCLKKRHIENYFLDEEVLFKVAEKLYLTAPHPEITKEYIETEMKKIAEESINYTLLKNAIEHFKLNYFLDVPSVKDASKKSINVLKREFVQGISGSLSSLSKELDNPKIQSWLDTEERRLRGLLGGNQWKDEFQGKYIYSRVCADILKDDDIKIRQAYVDTALEEKTAVFADIQKIFKEFK